MRRTLSYCLIYAALCAALPVLADVIPDVKWDVETGRLVPQPYNVSIRRGESVNLKPRYLSYGTPMAAVSNATISLRYSDDGGVSYYAVTGSVVSAAETGRVWIAWNAAHCGISNSYAYEIRATLNTSVLARAYGTLTLLTGTGSAPTTNPTVRTAINWATVDQTGGPAVLSNQMGGGSTWDGSAWTFASADLSWSNDYYRASNPSNYITLADVPADDIGWTNRALQADYLATSNAAAGAATPAMATSAAQAVVAPYTNHQDRTDNPHTVTLAQVGGIDSTSATGIAEAVVAPWTNQVTGAAIAAAGGLTSLAATSSNVPYASGGAGYIPNSAWNATVDLLPYVTASTCTITRTMGPYLMINPTGTVHFTADTSYPTNGAATFSLDLFYNAQTFSFVSPLTNTATLVSNAWNSIIFHRGAGATLFIGR